MTDEALIVVPARYGSTRLLGKPLIPIAGRTLLERVAKNARMAADVAGNCAVVVATDDDRIADHVRKLGHAAIMTSLNIDSGSSRAWAAVLAQHKIPQIIVNLQGDALFVEPTTVAGLIENLRQGKADVATAVYRLDWKRLDRLRAHKQTTPFSGTTCLRGENGDALWFSKTIIPSIRDEQNLRAASDLSPVWQHIGLYGYRYDALAWFATTPQSQYEKLEGLEQLRFLEAGRAISTVQVDPPTHALSGIDTAEDLALAEEAIARLGDPFSA
ncbi:3-deoxy-manno-octulosonate cytidylyltransferase [Novosphingobium sp.]|uniref:3-deoxy-manno-octulosonate cytidylyltransferase n=1 Tax=Novosphingobium sp. TaxID=1874826 RepID=UPI0025DB35F8|nr:manno-octulosonate cytidylyltransferase [Novosphingobium sp.]